VRELQRLTEVLGDVEAPVDRETVGEGEGEGVREGEERPVCVAFVSVGAGVKEKVVEEETLAQEVEDARVEEDARTVAVTPREGLAVVVRDTVEEGETVEEVEGTSEALGGAEKEVEAEDTSERVLSGDVLDASEDVGSPVGVTSAVSVGVEAGEGV
jgi:hypothetical protein